MVKVKVKVKGTPFLPFEHSCMLRNKKMCVPKNMHEREVVCGSHSVDVSMSPFASLPCRAFVKYGPLLS